MTNVLLTDMVEPRSTPVDLARSFVMLDNLSGLREELLGSSG